MKKSSNSKSPTTAAKSPTKTKAAAALKDLPSKKAPVGGARKSEQDIK